MTVFIFFYVNNSLGKETNGINMTNIFLIAYNMKTQSALYIWIHSSKDSKQLEKSSTKITSNLNYLNYKMLI